MLLEFRVVTTARPLTDSRQFCMMWNQRSPLLRSQAAGLQKGFPAAHIQRFLPGQADKVVLFRRRIKIGSKAHLQHLFASDRLFLLLLRPGICLSIRNYLPVRENGIPFPQNVFKYLRGMPPFPVKQAPIPHLQPCGVFGLMVESHIHFLFRQLAQGRQCLRIG